MESGVHKTATQETVLYICLEVGHSGTELDGERQDKIACPLREQRTGWGV